MTVKDERVLIDLAMALKGKPIALIGAGMSTRVGYPSWEKLLDDLHKKATKSPTEWQNPAENLRTYPDVLWRAEAYRGLLGEVRFRRELEDAFGKPPKRKDKALEDLLALPFRHVLTTNYDRSLEIAHERAGVEGKFRLVNWAEPDHESDLLARFLEEETKRHYIYLHGHCTVPRSMVLADGDYTKQYLRALTPLRRLFAVFSMQRVVFFGFSLTDPDLMNLLREVNAVIGGGRHFAVLGTEEPAENLDVERERLLRKFGIAAVFYKADKKHTHLGPLVRWLREATDSELSREQMVERQPVRGPEGKRDPEDPHKGRFGGHAERGGRRLEAEVSEDKDPDWFKVRIWVKATKGADRLERPVTFFLHPTFIDDEIEVTPKRGVAAHTVWAYGAFTVGAKTDRGKLELDLATLPDAPEQFKLS